MLERKRFEIPNVHSETVNQIIDRHTMAKRNRTKGQAMRNKTPKRKLKTKIQPVPQTDDIEVICENHQISTRIFTLQASHIRYRSSSPQYETSAN